MFRSGIRPSQEPPVLWWYRLRKCPSPLSWKESLNQNHIPYLRADVAKCLTLLVIVSLLLVLVCARQPKERMPERHLRMIRAV